MSFDLSDNTKKLFNGYSVKEDYLKKSISSQSLYNANLILSGYDNTEMIIDSLKNKIDTNEKEIAFCFSLLLRLDEIGKFLEENQQAIKKYIIEHDLKYFTLDDININLSTKLSDVDFDYSVLYNGTALIDLNSLKRIIVNNIEYLCKKIKEVEFIFNNLKDIFNKECIEYDCKIMQCFKKAYYDLDIDVLDEISENKNIYEDAYEIAKNIYEKYELMILGCNDNMYLHYLGKNVMMHNYINYICLYQSYVFMKKNIDNID